MRKLLRPFRAVGAIPGVPFHMELYALSPEKFGAFRPGPMPREIRLSAEQLRGEYWLHVLRLVLLGTTAVTGLGLLIVAWNFATTDAPPPPHPSQTPGLTRPF